MKKMIEATDNRAKEIMEMFFNAKKLNEEEIRSLATKILETRDWFGEDNKREEKLCAEQTKAINNVKKIAKAEGYVIKYNNNGRDNCLTGWRIYKQGL